MVDEVQCQQMDSISRKNRFWIYVFVPVIVGLAIAAPFLVRLMENHNPATIWYLDAATQTYMYKGDTSQKSAVTITIPDTYKDLPVTAIGANAFKNFDKLQSVTLPANLKTIYDNAFNGCIKLASIDIPDGVTEIQYGAFQNCTSLASVKLPAALTEIGGWTFQNCTSLTSVTIPALVTDIDTKAFMDCSNLNTITILRIADVVKIRADTFDGCTIDRVNVPNSNLQGDYGNDDYWRLYWIGVTST